MPIQVERIYREPSPEDGYRVLVDRIWPRGVSKDEASLDEWRREIAPSDALREWFDHDPDKWDEFRRRYLAELKEHREELRPLAERAERETVTLLFGARDEEHNNAVVVAQYLRMFSSS